MSEKKPTYTEGIGWRYEIELMLAPWPYHTEKRTITRQQCLALNAMAAAICNEPWTPELEQSLL